MPEGIPGVLRKTKMATANYSRFWRPVPGSKKMCLRDKASSVQFIRISKLYLILSRTVTGTFTFIAVPYRSFFDLLLHPIIGRIMLATAKSKWNLRTKKAPLYPLLWMSDDDLFTK